VPSVEVGRLRTADATARLEATMARAASFSEDDLQRGVNDEWSTVESLRHVVLIVDLWLSKTVLGEADPFHPMALLPTFMPATLPGTSIDPGARPSFDEACTVVRERLAALGRYVDGLTADELERPVAAHAKTVGGALDVLLSELAAHDHFVNRDLDLIRGSS